MMTTNVDEKYQLKTDKQHILDTPDMYIGSIHQTETNMFVYDDETKNIICKNIIYIPALFKLFDEAIVNARDHYIRMKQNIADGMENAIPVSEINVEIDEEGTITIINNGNGIDIVKHGEYNIWIPEMIFAHLRSSTNYNKEEKRVVGGKNGFGIKLVFIWSVYGYIETIDHTRQLKYTQSFLNNISEMTEPQITKITKKQKPYTKIVFKPDYQRLGISNLSQQMISLFKKRTYDIGAITTKEVKVKFNNETIEIKNFKQYIELYTQDEPIVYEEANERWEYAVSLSKTGEFSQVSFVNGINTYNGGKHIEYISNQIIRKLIEFIEKKKKVKVSASSIKEQLFLFLNCVIENPSFNSQSKDCLTTTSASFGSSCVISDKFIEKIAKLGVMEYACNINAIKENKQAKKTDGTKEKTVRGIPKLVDANDAGTERSRNCILILCEGDSAKAGILSGLSSQDKNYIGVYPLKGKLLNVRGENIASISNNKEISDIKKILGLKVGENYETVEDVYKSLRYGKIMILTDSDVDGSHIKGLIINLFHSQWPSLLKMDGFISFMNTPILKGRHGTKEIVFYNEGQYLNWKEQNNDNVRHWKIKYYKGLGTSTGAEFKEYFKNKKIVDFANDENTDEVIDMVFNKKRAKHRKDWLMNEYDRKKYVNTDNEKITYKEFIDKELIHFSKYDCDRSIPNLIDGLKTSQRKILYCAFKRNLTSDIKVAQFSGYVSEHSNYHHGEASLNGAIIGLAQNFVGSNNINLFYPNGQFGSRITGGTDHASERYIFTSLSKITRSIFIEHDDNILTYLNDDGVMVEPEFYCPIIPMVLVNGTKGIGTGFSTEILCYNPTDIVVYLKNKLTGISPQEQQQQFIPYYQGFRGKIIQDEKDTTRFIFKGVYEIVSLENDIVRVKELPVGVWIDDFKVLLENLCSSTDKAGKKITPILKTYSDNCTDKIIDMTLTFQRGKVKELLETQCDYNCNGLEKTLKLYSVSSTTNMHLFDANDKLRKYETVPEIIDDYYTTRLHFYDVRKTDMIRKLEGTLKLLKNKVQYIEELLNDVIDLRRKTNTEIEEMMTRHGYDKIDDSFKYLLKMSMDSVSQENIDSMRRDFEAKTQELEKVINTSIEEMWLAELGDFMVEYEKFQRDIKMMYDVEQPRETNKPTKNTKKTHSSVVGGGGVKRNA